MGTLHAWSVLVADLEAVTGIARAAVSMVYSGALVCLTLAVLVAVPLYSRWSPSFLIFIAAVVAGAGLLIAGTGSLTWLVVGYSIVFGAANGLAYGFALQLSARVWPARPGFAMGITTASYGLGAVIGAQILGWSADVSGSLATLRMHAVSFFVLAPLLWFLIRQSGVSYVSATSGTADDGESLDSRQLIRYWLAYGLACAAGLMAIAHAEPFLSSLGGSTRSLSIQGVAAMGVGNVVAGVVAGVAADRIAVGRIVVLLPLVSAAALLLAAFVDSVVAGVVAIVVVGLCYGATIAVYPLVVAKAFGSGRSAKAYGRVFTSWGLAGLVAPIVAGYMFDATQSYRLPMLLALCLSVISAVVASTFNTDAHGTSRRSR